MNALVLNVFDGGGFGVEVNVGMLEAAAGGV